MKNNTITLILSIFIIIIFSGIFLAKYIIFEQNNKQQNDLEKISIAAKNGEWDEAMDMYNKANKNWKRGKNIIALNYAAADYSQLASEYCALEEVISVKDLTETVKLVKQIKEHHKNFSKFIPEP